MKHLKSLFLCVLLAFLTGCSHVSYLWQAGMGQLSIYNHERDLEEVIKDPSVSEELKEKLRWIPEIKTFVEQELGEKATSNYTTFVKLDRPYVTWSLTCAEKYELKLKTWSFPIVGSFPYLGFFSEEKARDWQMKCEENRQDTYVRGVAAYSTIGYLRDPLLSSMLSRRKEDLVNLVFHETTHGIVYLKGQGSFNEQFASFIGDYGEKTWIVKKYGEKSKEHEAWKKDFLRRKWFGNAIKEFHDELKMFYEKSKDLPIDAKEKTKVELFEDFQKKLSKEGFEGTARTMKNNAVLLAFLTYEDEQDLFSLLDQKFRTNLKAIMSFVKKIGQEYEDFPNSKKETLSPQSYLRKKLSEL